MTHWLLHIPLARVPPVGLRLSSPPEHTPSKQVTLTFSGSHSEATGAVTFVSIKPGLLSGHTHTCTLTPYHTLPTLAQLTAEGCHCTAGATPVRQVFFQAGSEQGNCVCSIAIHLSHSKISSSIQLVVGFSSSFKKQPPEECL